MKANTIRTKRLSNMTLTEMKKEYEIALNEITKEMSKLFMNASVTKDGILSPYEMNRYNRLNNLFTKISNILNNMSTNNTKLNKILYGETFKSSYYRLGYSIDKSINAFTGFNVLNPEQVTAAMNLHISGLTLTETLSRHTREIQVKIRSTITQGIIQGFNPVKMASSLKHTLNGDYKKAIRVARTESGRAQNLGELKSIDTAELNGVGIKKVWISTLDDLTRDTHAELDGQIANDEGYFIIDGMRTQAPNQFGIASQDINCRCSLGYEVENFTPTTRIAKSEKGKNIRISNMSYKEWKQTIK